MPGEEDFSRFDDSATLICPDSPFEPFGTHFFPGFDLDEGEDALALGDYIDLAAPGSEIPPDDGPAFRLEKGRGDVLAPSPLGCAVLAHGPAVIVGLLAAGKFLGIEGASDKEGLFGHQVDDIALVALVALVELVHDDPQLGAKRRVGMGLDDPRDRGIV